MQKNRYPEVNSSPNFPEIEMKILKYWQENNSFQNSINSRAGAKEFIFYDGPPFANGLPHYGHLLTGFIKDVYARYQTTKGKKVERRFGWDCHGLPAEMQAEKELNVSGRKAITDFGIDKFNKHCQRSVMKYSGEWQQYVERQARWVDFENSYKTMDINFMESVLWAFKELYDKGLIYEAMRVMPYSWACETPLSNFETRLDNSYRDRADNAITVSFELEIKPDFIKCDAKECRIIAWTTTPWTLPSNLALAAGADIDYAIVPSGDRCYIIGKFALDKYAKELQIDKEQSYQIIKGKQLAGLKYKSLFDYFKDNKNSFVILNGDFVTEDSGTGIVHIAPGFGEEDQILCKTYDIDLVCPVDSAGRFTNEVSDFTKMQVFEANDPIIIALKKKGNWLKTEQYIHSYPHCWRTDTPLIYKAVSSWYVKVTAFKDKMVELNQQINWIPYNVKDNLFGKWLHNARDWSISRNRFFGTPIPIWRSDDSNYPRIDVYGSIEALQKDFGVEITDLHRPFIDELVRPNPDDPTGKSMMRRTEDVFDCWFESGSMPYAQVHYPFKNKAQFEAHFPADFIVEYSAQTRGWFYTLMVLSTALFDQPPFLNCICHGVILDTEGKKLSKRLNNYADPLDLFKKYGSDALRVMMLSSNVVKGQELLIDKEGKMVYDSLRLFIKPIWNAYHFFCMYANADSVIAKLCYNSENRLDQYILSRLKIAVLAIKDSLDKFDTQQAYNAISTFFERLNNWYIRRSRSRFWRNVIDYDKVLAYDTLFTCLSTMCKAGSSLMPLIFDEIYLGLGFNSSVHLSDFPDLTSIDINSELVSNMDRVLDICNSSLFIRNSLNIRVRQPLQSITIIYKNHQDIEKFSDLIEDEINVKNVYFKKDIEQYANFKLAINFPILGKRLPHKIKDIINAAKNKLWQLKNEQLEINGEILLPQEFSLKLEPKNLTGTKTLNSNDAMIMLDLKISDELYQEGLARDIVRLVQQARKEANLMITDHITLKLCHDGSFDQAIAVFRTFINEQTLSKFSDDIKWHYKSKEMIEDKALTIYLNKI